MKAAKDMTAARSHVASGSLIGGHGETVEIEVEPMTHFDSAVAKLIGLADSTDMPHSMVFNSITLIAHPGATKEDLWRQWDRVMAKKFLPTPHGGNTK